jgi:circadian clock protein KaiC
MVQIDDIETQANQTFMKCRTGIKGLDEITNGGFAVGRPTLVCGGSGCGKTLLAMEFLVRGATELNEPGFFMAFEENSLELAQNFATLGFDLARLTEDKLLDIDHVLVERSGLDPTGDYDLEGLFIRIGHAVDAIGAKRVVLDSLEALFSGFSNDAILRLELRRLFHFLKDKGVTTVVTAEQGDRNLTRFGLEEYVADCVIFLDHKVTDLIATRRLRIIKYRGSAHGTNEYPFLIDDHGLTVMPISSLSLEHKVTEERVSTGVPRLDNMMGVKGYYRGSSILITGTAGSGKSSLAAHFVESTCARGERCLYFAFEESRDQIIRNMRSIGINLRQWEEKGLLEFRNTRSTLYGMEMHLVTMHKAIETFKPTTVIIDPVSNLLVSAKESEVLSMLSRLVDYLKLKGITALCTDLTAVGGSLEKTEVGISPLMDTWILLQTMEGVGERNRGLYILKSRGMEHSNQVREFILTSKGILLQDVYTGTGKVLTGAARLTQEALEEAESLVLSQEILRKEREIQRKKTAFEAQVTSLQTDFEAAKAELEQAIANEQLRRSAVVNETRRMALKREADEAATFTPVPPAAAPAKK